MVRPLTDLPTELANAGYRAPSYRFVYEQARSAQIHAIRGENGRWTFDTADLHRIAKCLCLTTSTAA